MEPKKTSKFSSMPGDVAFFLAAEYCLECFLTKLHNCKGKTPEEKLNYINCEVEKELMKLKRNKIAFIKQELDIGFDEL